MSDNDTHIDTTPVDELWLRDWAAEGIAAFETYLAKHAAFAAFLAAQGVAESAPS